MSTAICSLEEYKYMYQQASTCINRNILLCKRLDKFYLTGYSHHVKLLKGAKCNQTRLKV